jgi:hypothetical protein
MTITITIEINETDPVFDDLINTQRLSIDIAFDKYKFDILKDKQEKRLEYLAEEISLHENDVLVGHACYNLDEILYLNRELEKRQIKLDTVFIPSSKPVENRIAAAKENARLHGRWIGSDELVIKQNFDAFKETLGEIKEGLSEVSIELIEC